VQLAQALKLILLKERGRERKGTGKDNEKEAKKGSKMEKKQRAIVGGNSGALNTIRAISGEMTMATPPRTTAGSSKQRDFPPPVGRRTKQSLFS
jgi:hypothetical protein